MAVLVSGDWTGLACSQDLGCFDVCAQLHLTLCSPVDGGLPGSSVHGILQARILGTPLGLACSLGISNFLEEISSLSHSIVFFCFFALIIPH